MKAEFIILKIHPGRDKPLCAGCWANRTQEKREQELWSLRHWHLWVSEEVHPWQGDQPNRLVHHHDHHCESLWYRCAQKTAAVSRFETGEDQGHLQRRREGCKNGQHAWGIMNAFEWQLWVTTSPIVRICSKCLILPIKLRLWRTMWRPRRFQQQDWGRSQSREQSDCQDCSESRDWSASRDRSTGSCYSRSHQDTCPAINKKFHNCLRIGYYATNCKSLKAMTSATSTLSTLMGTMTIGSAHNPKKLDLVEA